MKNILRIEYKRAVHSIGMLAALIMGIGCIVYQVIPIIQNQIESSKIEKIYHWHKTFTRGGFYNLWLPSYINGVTIYFFYFIGIIVALPYGISYYSDKKSGLIKNICNRVDKKKYLRAKYIAVFTTGGIAAVIPLIVDLLIVKIIIPIDYFGDLSNSILIAITKYNAFIIDHPYIAMILIMVLWFIFAGALATVSLMISAVSNNFFTIQLTPFFLMMVLFYMPTFLPVEYSKFFPFYFLLLWGEWNPVICIIETLLIVLVTYSVFVMGESRRDTL